jgi:orotate phosphoribosyltransferase
VKEDLVRRMVEASELRGDFVLSSGRRSSVYFDKFRFLTRPDLLRDVAREVATLLAPATTLLGAPEGAAMLLVAAVSLETQLPVAVVRKQPKEYGTRAQVAVSYTI